MTQWSTQITELENGGILKYSFKDENHNKLSYREFIDRLCHDVDFRSLFNRTLAQCPIQGFRFETPPVSNATFDLDFEFVLLAADYLVDRVDSQPFQEHFRIDRSVVVFHNLSGESPMVVPCPRGDKHWYGHLGSFVRHAGHDQTDEFWRLTGEEMATRVGDKRLWLNTHGGGVAWLHMRIDNRPKYLGYTPYGNDIG